MYIGSIFCFALSKIVPIFGEQIVCIGVGIKRELRDRPFRRNIKMCKTGDSKAKVQLALKSGMWWVTERTSVNTLVGKGKLRKICAYSSVGQSVL